jgi:hypothetical protein
MKDILLTLALLACPLGMLAMGAIAWLGAWMTPGRRDRATTSQSSVAEQLAARR